MRRIVITIFLFRFFGIASPIVGIFSAFMFESNLSPIQMSISIASFMLAMNLFEVPSSMIADKYSRKMVIVIAMIIWILSNIVFLFSQASWTFTAHMIIAGIGLALISGTVEAFIYDELKAIGQEDKYQKVNSIYHIAWSLGLATSLLLSSWLVQFGYYTIVVTSLFCCFLSLVVFVFGAKETKRIKNIEEAGSLKAIFLEGGKTLINNKILLYLYSASIIYGVANCVLADVAIVTSMEIGWDKSTIARIFGFNTIFEALLTFLIVQFVPKTSVNKVIILSYIVLIIASIGMFFAQKLSIFMVFPLWWNDRLKNMVFEPYAQARIKSSSRATTTSCVSMCFGIFYTIGIMALGVIATIKSFAFAFFIITATAVILLAITQFYFEKIKQIRLN